MKKIGTALLFLSIFVISGLYLHYCIRFRDELLDVKQKTDKQLSIVNDSQIAVSGQLANLDRLFLGLHEDRQRFNDVVRRVFDVLDARKTKIETQVARAPTDLDRIEEYLLSGMTPDLEERLKIVDKLLAERNHDPDLKDLCKRYTMGDNGPSSWSLEKFLNDPEINPSQVTLSDEDKALLDLIIHKARLNVTTIDTERELFTNKAIVLKLREMEEFRQKGQEPPEVPPDTDAVVATQFDNMTIILPAEEFPVIRVLARERDPAITDGVKGIREFFKARS